MTSPINAFIGQNKPPTTESLAAVLGPAQPAWDQLLVELAERWATQDQEWHSYSPKAGWALRLKRKQRTIVWLSPAQGCFVVLFILGDKAMQAARASKLSQRVRRVLEQAPKYPEGTGVRLTIKTPRDLAPIRTLAEIKSAH
jgi:hypothetical protein